MNDRVNLTEKLAIFDERWAPRPVAEQGARLLLIEPTGTPNTGDENTAAKRRRV